MHSGQNAFDRSFDRLAGASEASSLDGPAPSRTEPGSLRIPQAFWVKTTSAAPSQAVVSHDQYAGPVSLRDECCPAACTCTMQHDRHIAVDGVLADVQFRRYLLVRVSISHGAQDFDLARS
jgi:hypothetical protein